MEAIQEAIRQLEKIPTTIRKEKDVEAAIIQLPSTVRLLELPSASPKTFARLAENLRARLLPLYRVSLSLTLEYVIAVFRFIHYSKLVPTLKVGLISPKSWETLLIALFSGILDILEESSNNKTRESIAYTLYPVFCPLYFVPTSGTSLFFDGEILSVVYQILTATVTSYPRNAATLREHHIERKSLGITISQTKDFLAIESLLDLFGSMIPSVKGGRDKRTAFIKGVFDPVVFKNTGSKIHRLLENISSPDWSVTAVKVIQLLAENDVSFPQPFEASRLLLNESFVDSFSPFYIDNKKFVINIDKNGRIETLSIPYSIINNILVSPSTDDNVQILVQLTKSPILGDQPMLLSSEGSPTISWNVKKLSLTSLVKALRSRELNIGKLGSNKLSKVKPIELDFHSNKQDSQVLTQKRFEQLSQSWALPASPNNERKIDQAETSPLLPDAFRQTVQTSNMDEVALPEFNVLKQPLTSFPTVFMNPDENLSLTPQTKVISPETPNHSCPTSPSPHSRNAFQKTLDEDDAKTLPPKLKRRQLIATDDEPEATVEDESKSVSIVSNPMTKMPPKQDPFCSITTPIEPLAVKAKEKAKNVKFQKPEPGISAQGDLKKLGERPTPNVESDIIDVDTEEKRTQPLKRGRQEASSPISIRPNKRVKYGRKGRTSSPATLSRSKIDFEEIPKQTLLKKVELESFSKSRASAMKGKNGKFILKPKASAKKQITKVQHVPLDTKPTTTKHPAKNLHNNVIVPSPVKEEVANGGGTAVRRSTRTSSLRSRSKAPQSLKAIESLTPRKPRKAPWEDPDFLEKSKGSSDQIISTSGPVHSSPLAEVNIAEMTEQSSDIDFFMDNTQADELDAKDCKKSYATVKVEHKELGEPAFSNHPVQEAIIIDLTTDTSPTVHQKAEKISKPPDVCIYRTHQASSHPTTKEETLKNEELLEGAGIATKTSIPPLDKAKTSDQASFKKIKIEEQSSPKQVSPRPVFKIMKIEKASPSVGHTTSNLKSSTQKDPSASLAMGDGKECLTVNFDLFSAKSLQPSNKIQIPPTKSFEVIYRELSQKRESVGYSNARHTQNPYTRAQALHNKIAPDPMQSVLEVIQQINEVVIHNIANRFEKVTESLNAGQRAILEATANSLQDMYHESARHFNEMVDLEEDYTSHRTIITSGTHDYIKCSEQLVQCFRDVALDHSRQNLSKRLPTTLFPKLSAIILNPVIKV